MKRRPIDKVILNGMLSGVLAMGIGTGSAFANGTQTTEPAASPAPVTVSQADAQKLILPGDFFYFLKTFVEKVEIVITTDDVQQAKLLKLITQKRIREADVLFERNEPNLAVVTLHRALDDQEQVMEDDQEDAESSVHQELADHYRSNLEALTFVLEKVKNPQAKAALARNIEKTKAKLALVTITVEKPGVVPATSVGVQVDIKPARTTNAAVDMEDDDHDDDKDSAEKALHEKLKQERKAAQEKAKQERKAAKEKAKQERIAAQAKAKLERKAAHESKKHDDCDEDDDHDDDHDDHDD
ncbi:hypothetical protein E5161_05950 [Cohnella pontilimi]|uniref:DUF5667 domain-containing protein n=1 Tax=Cohnella pontilimi TaxID=2564100 RepID=A0A4U0FEQ3_9BACL|nr:DUF5667 domain-containing protein [Cohnella pontilimi]TJY43426.1 hypothetical protein E5161_05950 [Cohnella pontilimi]